MIHIYEERSGMETAKNHCPAGRQLVKNGVAQGVVGVDGPARAPEAQHEQAFLFASQSASSCRDNRDRRRAFRR